MCWYKYMTGRNRIVTDILGLISRCCQYRTAGETFTPPH